MRNFRRILWHLLAGTRGGPLRVRLLQLLRARPCNTNQVALALGIDYKTAQHHLRVLADTGLVAPTSGYAPVFLLTADMEANLAEFERIAATLRASPAEAARPSEHGLGGTADE